MSLIKSIFRLCFILVFLGCTGNKSNVKIKERPNILFAIMDDATYKHMSAYGCKWVKTPNFDRVADQGILFNRAYTPNAKCAPSRSNILTGRNSWQLEEAANHWPYFPLKYKVVSEVLAENGYHVGYTGKGWAPGRAFNEDGSKRELLIKGYNNIKTTAPTTGISNNDYALNFNEFLADNKGKPFFFWYGGWEPHREYEFGSGIEKGKHRLDEIEASDIFDFFPKVDSVKTDLLDYAYEIEYFDQQLGKMLNKLEETGQLNNTLVVVTSDNGMPFPRVKGQEYEYSNHLPLAVMWADGLAHPGRKIDDFISFVDFTPTFLDLAGIDQKESGMQPITGHSFKDIILSERSGIVDKKRNTVLIGKERHDVGRPNDRGYPIRGIFRDDMLYLNNYKIDRWPSGNPETGYLNTDGSPTKTVILNTVFNKDESFRYWNWSFGMRPSEELYNTMEDPDCLNNLADRPEYADQLKLLKKVLQDSLIAQKDPRASGEGDIFDSYEYSDKSGVNFYERYKEHDPELVWGWVNDSDFQDLTGVQRVQQDSLNKK